MTTKLLLTVQHADQRAVQLPFASYTEAMIEYVAYAIRPFIVLVKLDDMTNETPITLRTWSRLPGQASGTLG
jgi:hypothetical protein